MKTRFAAWCLVVLCGGNAVANSNSHLVSIRGQIVAFRPAERIGQVVSGVLNRETFLLRLDGNGGDVVKVVYEHDGYSAISSASNEMALEVRRDRSCDGTYGRFVSESPLLTNEDKTNTVPPVTMLGAFNGLSPSSRLKCYHLSRGNIQMGTGKP